MAVAAAAAAHPAQRPPPAAPAQHHVPAAPAPLPASPMPRVAPSALPRLWGGSRGAGRRAWRGRLLRRPPALERLAAPPAHFVRLSDGAAAIRLARLRVRDGLRARGRARGAKGRVSGAALESRGAGASRARTAATATARWPYAPERAPARTRVGRTFHTSPPVFLKTAAAACDARIGGSRPARSPAPARAARCGDARPPAPRVSEREFVCERVRKGGRRAGGRRRRPVARARSGPPPPRRGRSSRAPAARKSDLPITTHRRRSLRMRARARAPRRREISYRPPATGRDVLYGGLQKKSFASPRGCTPR